MGYTNLHLVIRSLLSESPRRLLEVIDRATSLCPRTTRAEAVGCFWDLVSDGIAGYDSLAYAWLVPGECGDS